MREGWTYKKLNEVCDKGSSNIVINKLEDNNGDYPLYGASGLVKNVDFYHQDKPYIGIVKDGAGVGRVNTYPAYSSLVGTMQYIFAKEDCLLDYIKYFLVKLDLSHCVSGATIPHIYFKDYGKERIPVPSLSEQQSIVAELDKINELISLKKAQLSDLDSLAQSIFYDMFGDPVENEKGWEIGKISSYINVKGGFAFKSQRYTNKGIRLVQIANVWKDSLSWDDITYISEEDAKTNSSFLLKEGDIVMAMTRPIIQSLETVKVAIVNKHDIPCILNQRVCKFEIKEAIDNIWLYQFLRLPYFKYKIKEFSSKGMQPNVSSREIESIQLFLPPLPLQQEFAKRIELIEQQKAQISSTIKDLETLLASRMQYWFD